MAVSYLNREDELSASKWNELISEADRKLSLALDNHSICFARSSTANPDFFRQFLGQTFHFFNGTAFFHHEIFPEVTKSYAHSFFTSAASATSISTANTPNADHTRKIIRLPLPATSYYSQIGRGAAQGYINGHGNISLFAYSLEVHTKLHRQNASLPFEPYYILCEGAPVLSYLPPDTPGFGSGLSTLERVHNFTQVELVCDLTVSSVSFPSNYNKYNFFRIHNLGRQALTFNFPTGFSVSIPAGGSRCVRRTSVNGTYTEGYNHFQKMLAGDLRIYNGLEQFGMLDHQGMLTNNVTNPALLLTLLYQFSSHEGINLPKLFLDYSQFWDASSIYCNPNFEAISTWEVNPPIAGKGFFGEVADATPIGDLFYHFGYLKKVLVTGETETHSNVTFQGFASIEADMLAAGITAQEMIIGGTPGEVIEQWKLKPLIRLSASGTVDLVSMSTNLIAQDSTPDQRNNSPVKQLPVYLFYPAFSFTRIVGGTTTTEIEQKNLDGTLKEPLEFASDSYTSESFSEEIPLTEPLHVAKSFFTDKANLETGVSVAFKFTGFGPLFITSKTQPIKSYGREVNRKTADVSLSGTRIGTTQIRDFPELGWQTLVPESPYAFHSPRVERIYCDYSARVQTSSNGTIFFPNVEERAISFYHQDYDFYFDKITGDTTCEKIRKCKRKTGVSFLNRFALADPYFTLHNWALGRKTQYRADPFFPYHPTYDTDTVRWYVGNRPRLLLGGSDQWFGRWAQFNRVPLLVDYFNNIASYVNAITRVYPLNFLEFSGLYSYTGATGGIASTTYLSLIRPANQFAAVTASNSVNISPLLSKYGIPIKTINDLPSSFQTLKDAKMKFWKRQDGNILIETTTTPLCDITLPTTYSWVSVSDVSAAAASYGLKFIYHKASVPVEIQIEEAGFNQIFGSGLPTFVRTQINFYGFVEADNNADWCADIATYRIRSDEYEPAEIITHSMNADDEGVARLAELTTSDEFRRRRYGTFNDIRFTNTRSVTAVVNSVDRSHPAFRVALHNTTAKAIFEPSNWIEYAENWSTLNYLNFHALAVHGFSVITAEIKDDTRSIETTDLTGTGVLTASQEGAFDVSFYFDPTVSAL